MRRFLVCAVLVAGALAVSAASGSVLKVLPHFLDRQGRHSLSPSLYERDAYQARLRKQPAEISTLRFDVQWRVRGADKPLKLRLEARGARPEGKPFMLEQPVKPDAWGNTWSQITLPKEAWQELGEVTAWRVTVWNGDLEVAEQKSFLW